MVVLIIRIKLKRVNLVQEYGAYFEKEFVHWFYGNRSREQIDISVYKQNDHHLQ
jgi:hypothetical protein